MKLLHILSESDADSFFYERIAERVTGMRFTPSDIRLRRGSGESQVRASLKLLLSKFPKHTPRPDTAVLIALDNDRCPGHPGASAYPRLLTSAERRRPSRWKEIEDAMQARWGENRNAWPVDIAVALPVEMIESWVLLLLNPDRGPLPIHSRETDVSAIAYHAPSKPDLQLKDLADEEARSRRISKHELMMDAAEAGDLAELERISPSFRSFVEDLRKWSE